MVAVPSPGDGVVLVSLPGRRFGVTLLPDSSCSLLWDTRWPPGAPCPRCIEFHWPWQCPSLLSRRRTSLLPLLSPSAPTYRAWGPMPQLPVAPPHVATGRGEDILTSGDVEANPGPDGPAATVEAVSSAAAVDPGAALMRSHQREAFLPLGGGVPPLSSILTRPYPCIFAPYMHLCSGGWGHPLPTHVLCTPSSLTGGEPESSGRGH